MKLRIVQSIATLFCIGFFFSGNRAILDLSCGKCSISRKTRYKSASDVAREFKGMNFFFMDVVLSNLTNVTFISKTFHKKIVDKKKRI